MKRLKVLTDKASEKLQLYREFYNNKLKQKCFDNMKQFAKISKLKKKRKLLSHQQRYRALMKKGLNFLK